MNKLLNGLVIKNETINIANKFFSDVDNFYHNVNNYEYLLLNRVGIFFNDMNKLGKKEFSCFLRQQRFTTNVNDQGYTQNRNIDIFRYITILMILNYSESDLMRYFIPEFCEETKPRYTENSSKILYAFLCLRHWFFITLFGRPTHKITNSKNEEEIELISSLDIINNSLKKSRKNYLELIKNDENFNIKLDNVTEKILHTIIPFCNPENTPFLDSASRIFLETAESTLNFAVRERRLIEKGENFKCFKQKAEQDIKEQKQIAYENIQHEYQIIDDQKNDFNKKQRDFEKLCIELDKDRNFLHEEQKTINKEKEIIKSKQTNLRVDQGILRKRELEIECDNKKNNTEKLRLDILKKKLSEQKDNIKCREDKLDIIQNKILNKIIIIKNGECGEVNKDMEINKTRERSNSVSSLTKIKSTLFYNSENFIKNEENNISDKQEFKII